MNCWLECRVCRFRREIGPSEHGCPDCTRAPLEVRYEAKPFEQTALPGIWRWSARLPPVKEILTLGEGNTPLLPVGLPDGSRMWLKNETINPTWSYKDRFNAATVAMAREFGKKGVAATTTGNHGMSAAAFAAAGGLACAAFCHTGASEVQVEMMRRYGARTQRGGDRAAGVRALLESGEWFPSTGLCPRNGYSNPYGIEGYKTIAFELAAQLGRAPDRVYVPLGGGDGLYGIWKGFRELFEVGAIDRIPAMIGCQAEGANPYVRALRAKARTLTAVPDTSSAALSIAEAIGGDHALDAIIDSHGDAVDCTDSQLAATADWLAKRGIGVELSSAAPVAARLAANGAGDRIDVAVLTGAAIKWPEHLYQNLTNRF